MIHVELHNILSEADFLKDAHKILASVDSSKEVTVVTIDNRPAVVLIDIDQLEALTGKAVTPVAPIKPAISQPARSEVPVPEVVSESQPESNLAASVDSPSESIQPTIERILPSQVASETTPTLIVEQSPVPAVIQAPLADLPQPEPFMPEPKHDPVPLEPQNSGFLSDQPLVTEPVQDLPPLPELPTISSSSTTQEISERQELSDFPVPPLPQPSLSFTSQTEPIQPVTTPPVNIQEPGNSHPQIPAAPPSTPTAGQEQAPTQPSPFLSRVQQNNFEEPPADMSNSSPLG